MIHWPSQWFVIRAEMGQSDLATMMFQDSQGKIHRHHFHHRNADGFGKLLSLIQIEGVKLQAPTRQLKKPSRWLNFYLLFKGLILHPILKHNPWKIYYADKNSGLPDQVSSWFLSEEENQLIKKIASEKKLNLSFLLLSEIDRVIKKYLFKNPQGSGTWLIPVDVRSAYPQARPDDNYVSFIPVAVNDQSVSLAFEKYKKDLRSGLYWAFWELAQIGQYVGLSGMRWLARQGTGKSFWMGSFSDLGVWNQKELYNSQMNQRYWKIAPPGSHAYPVGVTTIEWCGNRSITLKIHPALCSGNSQEVSDFILNEFKNQILKTVAKSN